ncbi:GntR family transcriptional regulator [Proteiniclasticum aestuarii]|nr:GntR family transcriptional regulator [Proteiniclasticum aestuarii]
MSKTDSVYKMLKSEIVNGSIKPSQNLPEKELSEKYEVSRNTIKKALLMLEKENLVIIEPNKGAKVRAYSLTEVLEYLELRAVLEGFIARSATIHFTQEKLNEMQEILNIMKGHLEQNELLLYSQNNQKFHKVIYDACPNRTAVEMTLALKSQMSKYNMKTILIPGRDAQSFSEHSAILSAIQNKNADLAESLMILHIHNVRKTFSENYSFLF